jgi:23S rRNA (adenine1618-N6)-methyltransferase
MSEPKKEHAEIKANMHMRNKHRERYDFDLLIKRHAPLAQYVAKNDYGDLSIDFFNANAVKALNRALLFEYYNITSWDVPEDYLCPPIPGRADYLHYVADLLAECNEDKIPRGDRIVCFDLGVGANCIYPIIGHNEYGWSFIGSDIDSVAITAANAIVEANSSIRRHVDCRLQTLTNETFSGVIQSTERIDISICNPPFHASQAEAQAGNLRKVSNLKRKRISKTELNFGGKNTELWTEGGEKAFILKMIKQSAAFDKRCLWFTSLVSKHENLKPIQIALKESRATTYKTIEMSQGNKVSRLVAWSFLTYTERQEWAQKRWTE